jgi:hypothetical protein
MLFDVRNGQTSVVLRVKLRNSSVSTGAGLTGLTSASSGLIISTIADNEATATVYTVAGSTIETIATLGTFATPTATKCRFKEVDATNHKGTYELQLANARYAVASAKSLTISFSGATNLAECDVVVPLRSVDPYDAVRFGMTALPNAVAAASGGLPTFGTGTGQINPSGGAVYLVGSPKKGVALTGFQFFMALASDHYTPATGKTVTAVRSIDGGGFTACTNSATELSNGWYKITLSTSDMNGDSIALAFSVTPASTT